MWKKLAAYIAKNDSGSSGCALMSKQCTGNIGCNASKRNCPLFQGTNL